MCSFFCVLAGLLDLLTPELCGDVVCFFKGIYHRRMVNWKVWVEIDGLGFRKKKDPPFESGIVMKGGYKVGPLPGIRGVTTPVTRL